MQGYEGIIAAYTGSFSVIPSNSYVNINFNYVADIGYTTTYLGGLNM
jgi:hypothetical protein